MNKILAILNLIASIPVIAGVFGLAYVMIDAGPLDAPTDPRIIGGASGPTDVFLTCQPEPLSILVLGLYAGLFLVNGIVFWKNQSTTMRPTEPRVRGPVA